MTQEDDELVKRLLDETGIYQSSCFGCFKGFENYEYSCIGNGPDCIDSIKLLKKTRKRLWNNNKEAASTITRLNADLASAFEALRPFADFINTNAARLAKDGMQITAGSSMALRQLTFGDCRRAAAELAKHKGK